MGVRAAMDQGAEAEALALRLPDAAEFQHVALGHAQRRVRVMSALVHGAALPVSAAVAALVSLAIGADPFGPLMLLYAAWLQRNGRLPV